MLMLYLSGGLWASTLLYNFHVITTHLGAKFYSCIHRSHIHSPSLSKEQVLCFTSGRWKCVYGRGHHQVYPSPFMFPPLSPQLYAHTMSILHSQIDRSWKLWYRDEVFLPWLEGEPSRVHEGGVMLQVLVSFSKPAAQGTRGTSTSRVSAQCAQCGDVATTLGSSSCGWWKALFIKKQPFAACFFEELGCHWGNHSNGTGKVSCYSCFHIYVVASLAIILLLLGPLLYFPIGAKHSRALGIFAIIATDRANRSEESKPLL